MKKLILTLITALIYTGLYATGPNYASKETKEIIEKMVEAHGGYEKWKEVKTISFTTAMYSKSLGLLKFWINDQVTDKHTGRTYQDWPLVGSKLSYDGTKVWADNWNVGNPPSHQYHVVYYYLNLPWLTQESNVSLGEAELISHTAFDKEVYKIQMSFSDIGIPGKSKNDTYTLFIDSESYLLLGYEYTIGYGPLLDAVNAPKDMKVFGPLLRKHDYIAEINGLKYPMLFSTYDKDYKQNYGDHVIYNIKHNVQFDESRMKMTDYSKLDPAKDVRRN